MAIYSTNLNTQFDHLMRQYHPVAVKWHKRLTRYVRMDREAFLGEFRYTLFRTLKHFDENKNTGSNKFQRYFFASMKKTVNTLFRENCTKKRKMDNNAVSFSLKRHNVADPSIPGSEEIELNDLLHKCCDRKSRAIAQLRMMGNSVEEVCDKLRISSHEYRISLKELKENRLLWELVSSN